MIKLRNVILRLGYKYFAKPIFFLQDPESVHDKAVLMGRFLGSNPFTRIFTGLCFNYKNKMLEQNVLGIHFSNPIGLAAGFDKDAYLTQILPHVGFGHEEVGSITGEPCEGNPKPRLWRLPKSDSLQIFYGLKNDGCITIRERLKNKNFKFPIGTSIAKSNSPNTVDTEAGIKDYVKAYTNMNNIGHYSTINISCPNAFGGSPFTDPQKLDALLSAIEKVPKTKPIFLKISPDLTETQIDDIISVVNKHPIDGFICTNLTKKFDEVKTNEPIPSEKGGLSGKIVEGKADNLIASVYKKTKGKYIIIGCGGVFTAEDAYKKIKLGASLIHMITGMIFEGPQSISEINRGLVDLLKKDGYANISEAVGVGNPLN